MSAVKKTSAKIRKADEKAKSSSSWLGSKEGNSLKTISTIMKALVAIMVPVFAYVMYKQSTSAITDLINADQLALKDAIFGDLPHLFYCDRGTAGSTAKNVPAIFTELNLLKGSKMGFAVLNCSQVLPSGKSIYERFKLKKEWKPTIWGTAPWSKPLQAGPSALKDVSSLKKFVEDSFTPKGAEIKSDKQLHKFCAFDKALVSDEDAVSETCFVLSKGTRFGKSTADLEQRLISAHPKTKFASIDASKLRLHYENVEEMPADAFALRLHALRNGTHYMSMVNPVTWDYLETFVSQALASSLGDYVTDKQKVRIVAPYAKKAVKKPKKDKVPAEKTAETAEPKEPAAKKEAAEEVRPDPAEVEAAARAEQAHRERLIREQMDRKEKEYLFETGTDDVDAEEETEEEGDEETIEL